MTPVKLAQAIPTKVRVAIYSILFTLYSLELIWDWLEDGVENKLVGSATILGFGIAAANGKAK